MRIAGQEKLGYYPTPDCVVALIKTWLDMSAKKFVALDPCCGKGYSLRDLLAGTNGLGYGVEINEGFIPEAKTNLYKVARGDYRAARITNNGFSLLYLNPPYDNEAGTETTVGQRKEYTFLKNTVKYLKKDGVLVYIIPQKRLVGNVAKMLSYRFRKIQVFKFPEEEYQAFNQVVVFGILKDSPLQDVAEAQRIESMSDGELPELAEAAMPEYVVPESEPVPIFRSGLLNVEEALDGIAKTALRKRVRTLTQNDEVNVEARPILEPRKGHLAMLLAAGYGNGVLGKGKDRHIVKGKVEPMEHTEMEEEVDESGNSKVIRKVTQSHAVKIYIRKCTGEVVSLMA